MAEKEEWENELTVSMAEKLSALGGMLRHLPPQAEVTDGSVLYSVASMLVIMSPHSTNYQRAACSTILDYTFPEWREHLSLAAVGAVADRSASAVRRWRNAVLGSDGQCADCCSTEELEAHHIVRWADNVFLRVDPTNGKTLCRECHLAVHGRLH